MLMGMLSDDSASERSLIISMSEVIAREGIELARGMNFRDSGGPLSVLLSLPRDGEYTDTWDAARGLFIYEGHDSIAEGARGREDDQLLMYASGKPTENGKFYKAAHAYKDGQKDGMRELPLQVQVYEKLDPGVFFDKGIFNLADATFASDGRRKVVKLYLSPADAADPEASWSERMIDLAMKAEVWKQTGGRCATCAREEGLHFMLGAREVALLCTLHKSRTPGDATI